MYLIAKKTNISKTRYGISIGVDYKKETFRIYLNKINVNYDSIKKYIEKSDYLYLDCEIVKNKKINIYVKNIIDTDYHRKKLDIIDNDLKKYN